MTIFRRLLTLLLGVALLGTPALLTGPAHAEPGTAPASGIVQWGLQYWSVPSWLDGQRVVAIANGDDDSVALTAQGKVATWGWDYQGRIDVPSSLDGKKVTAVAAGGRHFLALTDDGKVVGWGENEYGQSTIPQSLNGKKVTAIDAGYSHSLALTDDGTITGWGYNEYGQASAPASLNGKKVTAITAGALHSLALTDDGTITAWGDTEMGQGTIPQSLNGKKVTAIDAGYSHSLALTDDGTVTGWGDGWGGQTAAPQSLDGEKVTAIAAGFSHSLALTDDGKVVSWGYDSYGETFIPEALDGEKVTAIAAGKFRSTAVTTSALSTGLVDDTAPAAAGEAFRFTPTGGDGSSPADWTISADDDVDASIDEETGEVTLSSTVAGTHEVILTAPTSTGTTSKTVSFIVSAGPAVELDVTASSTEALYGDSIVITATGEDTYGNSTGDESANVTLTSSDDADDVEGTTVTVGSAGARTITATHTNGSQGTVDVEVSLRSFATGPAPAITGTVKVGEQLTADAGTVSPDADSIDWQWLADGKPVTGANTSTFTPTRAHVGSTISVEATAHRAGYTSVSATSVETAQVATDQAPTISFAAEDDDLRRGQLTDLIWSVEHAAEVTGSGAWSGAKDPSGRVSVKPGLGSTTWILSATNENGTSTAQVSVFVTREARTFKVAATNGLVLRGKKVAVKASGLDPKEPYAIEVAGKKIASGAAGSKGTVSRTVTVPTSTPAGAEAVTVTGSERDRAGKDTIRVVANKKLSVSLKLKKVQASDPQKVTVRGLAAGEKVKVTYKGKRISPKNAKANEDGVYTKSFTVGLNWGKKTVKATGEFAGRKGSATFDVVRRTHDLGPKWR